MTPTLLTDGYKADHRRQYAPGTKTVMSNLTPRGSRVSGSDSVVLFGLQYFIKKYLIEDWGVNFFSRPKDEVVAKYVRRLNSYLPPGSVDLIGTDHIEALHDLGYLPLAIYAIPEGRRVPVRVPQAVVVNTHEDFYWLTNHIETILSTTIWGPCTSATTASQYRDLLEMYAKCSDPQALECGDLPFSFVDLQGHDFSFRGMFGLEAAQMSGAAHLLSFKGTDTIPAIDFLEEYYNADCEKELIGCSVPATEHSVMCSNTQEGELEMFERLITEVYPFGIVSIVSDTWNFWEVIDPNGGILEQLKDKIEARDGKVVIRPDSGDPVKIVTGYTADEVRPNDDGTYTIIESDRVIHETEFKGLIQCLWEIFGGTENELGFKKLSDKIGAIYGDSITLERARQISERLMANGFASTNIVYGIGSFTYQGAIEPNAIVTRDTYGYAVKATYIEKYDDSYGHSGVPIFKDPITDDGTKKSAKGITAVFENEYGEYYLKDEASWEELHNCALDLVFKDSALHRDMTLSEIRENIKK